MMHQFALRTHKNEELLDITQSVSGIVKNSKITNGACIVFVPHTTAAVMLNEGADPDVAKDVLAALLKLVPDDAEYSHAEGNSPAHIKASLIGNSVRFL